MQIQFNDAYGPLDIDNCHQQLLPSVNRQMLWAGLFKTI